MHVISDHAPILLSTDGTIHRQKRSFKFEKWWLKEKDFNMHAKEIWVKSSRKPFNQRTNHLAQALRIWCRKKKPLQQELNELEDQIKQIQAKPLADQDNALESSLIIRYEQNLTKLTESYMQRAKKNWIKDGDRNTAYFHRAILKRRRRNMIVSIKDENDTILHMPKQISNTFVNYFRHIFSSTNNNVGRPFLHTQILANNTDYT